LKYAKERKDLIYWSSLLNQKGFVTARSGNISCKADSDKVFLTSHDCYLGHLEKDEVVLVNIEGKVLEGKKEPTSEKDLHLAIHNKFKDVKVVVHSHSPYTTAFFHYFEKLDIYSFEAKFYLGDVAVILQETPTVTDVEPVLKALENTNIVVLKNHGVVAIGKDFKEAVSLIELLEEQARVGLTIKSANNSFCSSSDRALSQDTDQKKAARKYQMLSKEHRDRLADLANSDQQAQELGKKHNLSCTLAVKNQETNETMRFCYEQGKITKADGSEDAEFVIIGDSGILRKVFNGELDPFVATTQGKVKTKGDFTKMSKWYPVMVRTFKLWKQAPVE
jgi:L-fuculose-phosphate aldolase